MKNTVNERFKIFFESLKIKNEEFAENIEAHPKEASNWKKTTKIPLERLKTILLRYPQLNSRWLITGEGAMIETNYQQHDNRYSANDSPQPPPITQRRCSDPGCNAELVKLNDEIVRYKLIIDQLINRADMLRRDDPPEKYVTGGVAKSGQKSQNKKAG